MILQNLESPAKHHDSQGAREAETQGVLLAPDIAWWGLGESLSIYSIYIYANIALGVAFFLLFFSGSSSCQLH